MRLLALCLAAITERKNAHRAHEGAMIASETKRRETKAPEMTIITGLLLNGSQEKTTTHIYR